MLNAPSGIAQLRKSSEHTYTQSDPMNLDDFIFADNAATPTTLESPQVATLRFGDDRSGQHSMPSAIPIKSRKDQSHQFVPQSVPVPALHQGNQNHEFNYIQRHQRKTSIDDRRVSLPLAHNLAYFPSSSRRHPDRVHPDLPVFQPRSMAPV
jgi:GATA-binding protein, other eukaryote